MRRGMRPPVFALGWGRSVATPAICLQATCVQTIGREPPDSGLLAAVAFGTSDRARTYDPRIKNPLLYQLSYGGRLGAETVAISSVSCKLRSSVHFRFLTPGLLPGKLLAPQRRARVLLGTVAIAQLVRAPDCGSGSRGFESR